VSNTKHDWRKELLPWVILLMLLPLIAAGYRVLHHRLSNAVNGFFYPYLELNRTALSRLSDRTLLASDRRLLAARIEELQQQNRRLALQSAAAGELLEENRELRRRLALPVPEGWDFSVTEILIRDPLLRQESFTVNRGRRHGLAFGDAVADLTTDGRMQLIGVVGEVHEHSAKVDTICNPTVHISARLGSSGAVGFLNVGERSTHLNYVPLGYLPENCSAIRGEAVNTAGYESGVPPGLRIGVVAELPARLSPFANGSGYSTAELEPAVNFNRLRFLIVLKRRGRIQ